MSTCSKCPPTARTHDLRWSHHWSIAASVMSWSKSNQVCIKHFRRLSMSLVFVSYTHCCIINILKSEASVCATLSASINPLPSDRLRCCDRRSLAVKPLNSRPATYSEQVSVYPCTISDCSCWACAMTASKLMYAWCQLTQ